MKSQTVDKNKVIQERKSSSDRHIMADFSQAHIYIPASGNTENLLRELTCILQYGSMNPKMPRPH